jgi:hypothetical protein
MAPPTHCVNRTALSRAATPATTCAERGSSAGEQEHLAKVLDDYLSGLERGESITPEELLARHPEVAEQLKGYLSGLNIFHRAAATPQAVSVENGANGPELRGDLGDFRLVREIGRGGMGIVYEADQISLGRRVAIKVLPFAAAIDQKQITRFKNEAQAAAQVDHPNIVPVFAVGQQHGIHYFAMQLISGQSLADVLTGLLDEAKGGVRAVYVSHGAIQATDTLDHVKAVARMGLQAADCTRRMRLESCTGTSSRRTCCWTRKARCGSPTLAWPAAKPVPA